MNGYHGAIEDLTLQNTNFRQVLYTGPNMQLVLMCLKPGEEIGLESHHGHDQFFRFEAGTGQVFISGETFDVKDGDVVIVPNGTEHNVTNTSATQDLKLYTIYAPPEHAGGTINKTKAESEVSETH